MKRTMKRRYTTPVVWVIRIEKMVLMAGSETMGIDKSDANGVSDVNEVLSREFGCDFEEEEE